MRPLFSSHVSALGAGQPFEPRQLDLQHFPVKEEQSGKRLVLRCRGHLCLGGKVFQECGALVTSHLGGMSLCMEVDQPLDSLKVALFGAQPIMLSADGVAYLVEQMRAKRKCGWSCVVNVEPVGSVTPHTGRRAGLAPCA